jgi:hypothetical protein
MYSKILLAQRPIHDCFGSVAISIIYRVDAQQVLFRLDAGFLGLNHLGDTPQDRGQQFI